MKKGFTLMEILAVMIIIAILAAVAAPQYTRAAERSRATEAIMNVTQLAESVQRAQRTRGKALNKNQFAVLDVRLPKSTQQTDGHYRTKFFNYYIDKSGFSSNTYVVAVRRDGSTVYGLQIDVGANTLNDMVCSFNTGDTAGQQICSDLGYTETTGRVGGTFGGNTGRVKP